MNGREFIKSLPDLPCDERGEKILQAIKDGNMSPIGWEPIKTKFDGHEGVIYVSNDALMVGDEDPVRFTVTHIYAQKIVDYLGGVLPTAKISDEIYAQSVVKLPPCTQPADPTERKKYGYSVHMDDVDAVIRHHDDVSASLKGRYGLVAPVGKDWSATNKIAGRPDLAANYGLHDPRAPYQAATPAGGKVWQPGPGTKHNPQHDDYSQVLRIVKRAMIIDAREMDIEVVARDPELWGLVSSEGVMKSMRHPAVTSENPTRDEIVTEPDVSVVPEPKPVFTRTLRVGMYGTDVAAWQCIVMVPSDGVFGAQTVNATKSWQTKHRLVADGVVGPRTQAAAMDEIMPGTLSTSPGTVLSTMVASQPETILAKNYLAVKRDTVHWIVTHSMEAAKKPSTAEAAAKWAAGLSGPAPMASWNWGFDCDSAVISVPEDMIAYHAKKANKFGVGYEHAGYARQTREEWLDDYSEAMLYLSARTAATVTIPRWNLPEDNFVDAAGLKRAYSEFIDRGLPVPNELRGFTTHLEVTKGLGGTHTDPGPGFPWDVYLDWVRKS
jgi:peptidoglycan hydrolase-like protein with peptidoglycan-binding domain